MSAETSCTIVATANPALVRTLTLHETGEHDLLAPGTHLLILSLTSLKLICVFSYRR
jgi:hypothetical protein